ncbi:hypothetical protein B484DRAFT_110819 [Ochromonadaceae sp. CCMP2298]|nr:hypothetical protein B484DRAFT_110819 [Ochromonadaceae sp. CCMP2298]
MTQILARTTSLLPAVASGRVSWHDYWTKIVPPVPALLLTFVTGRQEPSLPLLGIVVVISGGVVLSTVGEMHFRLVGFIIQMSAVFSDCLRMVYTEAVLKDLNLDTLSMLYYHAPTCAVIIGVGFLIFEAPSFDVGLFTPALCVLLLLNAMLAFSLNVRTVCIVHTMGVRTVCVRLCTVCCVLCTVPSALPPLPYTVNLPPLLYTITPPLPPPNTINPHHHTCIKPHHPH